MSDPHAPRDLFEAAQVQALPQRRPRRPRRPNVRKLDAEAAREALRDWAGALLGRPVSTEHACLMIVERPAR